jgi:hypothetical protein
VVTGRRNLSTVQIWNETNLRRACKLAREIAKDFGQTLDDIYVERDGHEVYHLHRIDAQWHSMPL